MTFKERLTGLALAAPLRLARLLPYRWRVPFTGWITARIIAPLAGYNRRIRDNLTLARPDLDRAEIRRLMRAVPDNAGRNMVELYAPEFIGIAHMSRVDGPGRPDLHAARMANRPVIFVTGHIGSFNAARLAMVKQGFDLGVFYRPFANRPFNAHYVKAMAALSEPMFEQGRTGLMQMLRHLRAGGAVAILNDLNTHDGVPLPFFGQKALTSLSAAEMALKHDALLVPIWGLRNSDGLHFRISVEAPIEHSDAVTMTRAFNRRLEAVIRDNMDQWLWIHRRWKDGATPLGQARAQALESMQHRSAPDKSHVD